MWTRPRGGQGAGLFFGTKCRTLGKKRNDKQKENEINGGKEVVRVP